jgi:hypothetical protein
MRWRLKLYNKVDTSCLHPAPCSDHISRLNAFSEHGYIVLVQHYIDAVNNMCLLPPILFLLEVLVALNGSYIRIQTVTTFYIDYYHIRRLL